MATIEYLLDVGGTLAPKNKDEFQSQEHEEKHTAFLDWFYKFAMYNKVHLVTGSDLSLVKDRLGQRIVDVVDNIYCYYGNQVYCSGKLVKETHLELSEDLMYDLEQTGCQVLSGVYPGIAYCSLIGFDVSETLRDQYTKWDEKTNYRKTLCNDLDIKYPKYVFKPNGRDAFIDTHSIKILSTEQGKQTIVDNLDKSSHIKFYADKLEPRGSDYELGLEIERIGTVVPVKDWEDLRLQLLQE